MRNLKILFKVLVLLVISSVIPLLLVYFFTDNKQRQTISALAMDSLERTCFLNGKLFESYMDKLIPVLESLSKLSFTDPADLIKGMENYVAGAALGLDSGTVMTDKGTLKEDVVRKPEYQVAAANPNKVVFTNLRKVGEDRIISVATAAKDSTGSVFGVAWVELKLNGLLNEIAKEIMGREDVFQSIVSEQGIIFAHTISQLEGMDLSKENWFKQLLSSNDQITLVHYEVNKVKRTVAYYRSKYGWYLSYGMLDEYLYAGANQLSRFLVLIISAFIAAGLSLGWLISSKYISKPLLQFVSFSEILKQGDLTKSCKLDTKDEIGTMSKSINEATLALRNAINQVRILTNQVNSVAQNLASLSEEMAASNEELAAQMESINKNSQGVSASIEEINSGIEETAASSQNLSRAAQNLTDKAEKVKAAADKGEHGIRLIDQMINEVKGGSLKIDKSLKKLVEDAKNIGTIVETINTIAEQTNLLALNAAIEAARAGEAGRGFAVVADEIRKLAEGSKSATQKISTILENIHNSAEAAAKDSEESVKQVEMTVQQAAIVMKEITNILSEINEITTIIEGVAASAQELSASTEEMSSAMTNATRMVLEIAKQIEEATSAVKQQAEAGQQVSEQGAELSGLVQKLTAEVQKFKV